MRTADFDFHLPEELIAQYPLEDRTASRLLHVCGDQLSDRIFTDIAELIQPEDLLVFNNTRVIPARLFGHKATGGKLEVLVERILDDHQLLAHIRASKSPKPGTELLLEGQLEAVMVERVGDLFRLAFKGGRTVLDLLESYGHMPLPPYIAREDEDTDQSRYQTVYAEHPGAVAAPTAGLHFDEALLQRIQAQGTEFAYVTLHVGAGTFQPVRVDNIEDHKMHAERISVPASVVEQVNATRVRGGRVIAVGTTSVRSLESAAAQGELEPFEGESEIFIYPGYEFKVVDAMITNFHLPQSTLIMLVSAFAGQETIMRAYQHAVESRYRFFSYGDAMFLENARVRPASK